MHLGLSGPGSSVGIATELRAGRSGIESRWGRDFSARPGWPWGPPSLLYNGYRIFPGGKVRPGRAADHSPPSSAEVFGRVELYLYPPLGHNRACNGVTLLLPFCLGIWNTIRRKTMTVTLNGMQNVTWDSVIVNVPTRRRFEVRYGMTNLT